MSLSRVFISYLISLTFCTPLLADIGFGDYKSVQNQKLPYMYISSSIPAHSNRAFIYVDGDGDICFERDGQAFYDYQNRLKRWKDNAEKLSELGVWIVPKLITHKACEEKGNLDGIGFRYRYRETEKLVAKVERDFPEIQEIYLFGFSAGPIVAAEVIHRRKRDSKIKGLILGGITAKPFRVFFPSFFMRLGAQIGLEQETINQSIYRMQTLYDKAFENCSPREKHLFGAFQFVTDPPPPETDRVSVRTDNHYCEYANANLARSLQKLPKSIKTLILHGDSDPVHTLDSAYEIFNILLMSGKSPQIHIMKDLGHNYRETELVDVASKWLLE